MDSTYAKQTKNNNLNQNSSIVVIVKDNHRNKNTK